MTVSHRICRLFFSVCLAALMTACAVTDGAISIADRMSEPFMSLLTGEDLGDVSTDPQYSRRPAPINNSRFEPFDAGLGRPLAVVRYDSPLETYNQPLALAVGRALDVQPDTNFDVVSVSRPDRGLTEAADFDRAIANARIIMADLVRNGVDPAKINMNVVSDPAVTSDGEVHIYVR